MDKSKAYTLSAMLFGLIAIDVIAHHHLLAGLAMFTLAIGSALKAHRAWLHEHA